VLKLVSYYVVKWLIGNESSKLEEYQKYCLLHSERRLQKW